MAGAANEQIEGNSDFRNPSFQRRGAEMQRRRGFHQVIATAGFHGVMKNPKFEIRNSKLMKNGAI